MNIYCAGCGIYRGWCGRAFVEKFKDNLKPCPDCGGTEIIAREEYSAYIDV